MKIKALHIAAFGGIKNLDLNLENSFNVVYGQNENGKTTIMNFIKMIFYGTERGSAQLSKNLRKRYTPWDQSQMAGYIIFEKDGRSYRLERIFGSSNSTDKVTLFDLSLGTAETVAADIGSKLFGISVSAFERSIFIGQFGFPDTNDAGIGELNGKLSNIALTGDETISYDAVNKRLETAKTQLMSKSGRSGVYDKNLKLCADLEKELQKATQTQEIIEKANQKLAEIRSEIELSQQKASLLKQQLDSENDLRNSEKLKELLNLKEKLDEINKELTLKDGKLADEMFVRKVEFCLSKIQKIKDKISTKQNENQLLENNLNLALNAGSSATPENADALQKKIICLEEEKQSISEQITKLEQNTQKPFSTVWFVLASAFAILGAGGYLISQFLTVGGLSLALIFVLIGLITNSKAKTKANQKQSAVLDLKLKENQLVSLIAAEKSNLTAITAALNTSAAMIENQKKLISTNNRDIETFEAELKAESTTLFDLFAPFKATESFEEIAALLDSIKKNAAVQKELKQNINYIFKDIGNISYEQVKEKLSSINTDLQIDFEQVKTDYENLLQTLTNLKTNAATIVAEVKALSSSAQNPEAIKTSLEALQQKTANQKQYCNCLQLAMEVLADSYAEVRQNYGSVLEKDAGEIFASLTGGNYPNISISKSFDILVEKANVFGTKELEYLSSGTIDQAYLSLRLALSELITKDDESLPIILDDALAQYDDTRAATALEFLKKYSQKGQIILFTCHKAMANTAEALSANKITL